MLTIYLFFPANNEKGMELRNIIKKFFSHEEGNEAMNCSFSPVLQHFFFTKAYRWKHKSQPKRSR
jgi:hypothetical protein